MRSLSLIFAALLVTVASPAIGCSGPFGHRYYLHNVLPLLEPGEVAAEVEVLATTDSLHDPTTTTRVIKMIHGRYAGSRLIFRSMGGGGSCIGQLWPGAKGYVVGRILSSDAAALVIDARLTRPGIQRWVTDDDYPPEAQRAGVTGTTVALVTFGIDGRVSACEVTESSGSPLLDDQTCRLISRRGRIVPPKDAQGNPVTSTERLGHRWVLPRY